MDKKITYLKPDGEWGIEGVDLTALPPKVYSALRKLCDLEHPLGSCVTIASDQDGKWKLHDPYCTISIETEADLVRLRAAIAYYNEHVIDKEVQA